jgi:hypothetical protein
MTNGCSAKHGYHQEVAIGPFMGVFTHPAICPSVSLLITVCPCPG